MGRLILVLSALAGLSGCAALPSWWTTDVAKSQRPSVQTQTKPVVHERLDESFVSVLLKNYYRLSKAPDFDIAAYLKTAREQYHLNKNEKTAMEYVVATTLAGSPDDLAKVQELLKDIEVDLLDSKSDESTSGLAALLQRLVQQQKDTQSELLHQKQQLKDKDAHIAKLQQQINAIKSIEKSIHERRVGGTGEGK